jgi:hypothetical protein
MRQTHDVGNNAVITVSRSILFHMQSS